MTPAFHILGEVIGTLLAEGRSYQEFLRVPAMSCGVYMLSVGAVDPQKPHAEDELYYVISGAASMKVKTEDGEEDREVGPGDMIYVKAGQEHRFHDITQELVTLVIFAPAESA
jgi:mannose-6-phosphate isomerase-like protein (cupin superfamily)